MTSNHFHIFAEDLSNEVNGEVLLSHFLHKDTTMTSDPSTSL
jgi:carbonic anhydrase